MGAKALGSRHLRAEEGAEVREPSGHSDAYSEQPGVGEVQSNDGISSGVCDGCYRNEHGCAETAASFALKLVALILAAFARGAQGEVVKQIDDVDI